jgi:hypothetical protein
VGCEWSAGQIYFESFSKTTLLTNIPISYILSNGSLDSCVLQGAVGICSVGYGGSFSEAASFDEGGETFEEGISIPEAEPTPAG